MSEVELKPCPFCGGKANVIGSCSSMWTFEPKDFCVICECCGASRSHYRPNQEQAAEDWNMRAVPESQRWFSLTDSLPPMTTEKNNWRGKHKESDWVLCVVLQDSGERMVKEGHFDIYNNGNVEWIIPGAIGHVTHWMSLPPMPKEENT